MALPALHSPPPPSWRTIQGPFHNVYAIKQVSAILIRAILAIRIFIAKITMTIIFMVNVTKVTIAIMAMVIIAILASFMLSPPLQPWIDYSSFFCPEAKAAEGRWIY